MLAVCVFDHLFKLSHMFFFEPLHTGSSRCLIVIHVLVPSARELNELCLLLCLYLLKLLCLCILHVNPLSIKFPLGKIRKMMTCP